MAFDERAYQREYHPKWRAANIEHVREQSQLWVAANREKRRAVQKGYRERNKAKIAAASRARRSAYKGRVSVHQVDVIVAAASGHCTYCGLPVSHLELDHVDALARGGKHAKANLLPACRSCNASKGDKDVADWLFAKHGVAGLARAIFMLERRQRFLASPQRETRNQQ